MDHNFHVNCFQQGRQTPTRVQTCKMIQRISSPMTVATVAKGQVRVYECCHYRMQPLCGAWPQRAEGRWLGLRL